MIKINNKLELYTIAFYNKMMEDKKYRELYRIAYYLYLFKKGNFLDKYNYKQTRSGIIWPDNESLMFELVSRGKDIILYDKCLLTEEEALMIHNIYDQYSKYSLSSLKELVKEDLKQSELFKNLSLEDKLLITLSHYRQLYQINPDLADEIVDKVMTRSSSKKKVYMRKNQVK